MQKYCNYRRWVSSGRNISLAGNVTAASHPSAVPPVYFQFLVNASRKPPIHVPCVVSYMFLFLSSHISTFSRLHTIPTNTYRPRPYLCTIHHYGGRAIGPTWRVRRLRPPDRDCHPQSLSQDHHFHSHLAETKRCASALCVWLVWPKGDRSSQTHLQRHRRDGFFAVPLAYCFYYPSLFPSA